MQSVKNVFLKYSAVLMNCVRRVFTSLNNKKKILECKFSYNQENKKAAHLFAITNAAALQSRYILFQNINF